MDFSHCKCTTELPMIAAIQVFEKVIGRNHHAKGLPSESAGKALIQCWRESCFDLCHNSSVSGLVSFLFCVFSMYPVTACCQAQCQVLMIRRNLDVVLGLTDFMH